ncbi:hypothetical protein JCM19992_22150 [Thermostilla marina]
MTYYTWFWGVIVLTMSQAFAAADQRIVQESGVSGGLAVLAGIDDPSTLAALTNDSSFVVQYIDTRQPDLDRVTKFLREKGCYGRATVARFDGRRLPYVDNLVNLLIVSPKFTFLDDEEIMRVLAPRGVAWIGNRKLRKDIPPGTGDWTHHMFDASGIGSGADTTLRRPRSLQWKSGPEYSRSHENMSSVSAVVSAGGRIFSIIDEGPATSIYLPPKWRVVARDAYSGVLLWKRTITSWHARLFPLKSGPSQLPRRLVADENCVYTTLDFDGPIHQLDAATGETRAVFADTDHTEEILAVGDKVIAVVHTESAAAPYRGRIPSAFPTSLFEEQSVNLPGDRAIVVVDAHSGKTLWKTSAGPFIPLTVASDGRNVYVLRGNQLVSLNLADGRENWSVEAAERSPRYGTSSGPVLLTFQNAVYTAIAGTLTAFDSADGRKLWSAPCAQAGYKTPPGILVAGGLIWDVDTGGEPYRPGSDLTQINRYFTGYDPRNGNVVKRIPVTADHGYAIMHHRCHVPRASADWIITSFPGIEFFDVATGKVTHDSWLRGACLYGFLPANGLIYLPPNPCACYIRARPTGFWAAAGKRTRPRELFPAARLESFVDASASSPSSSPASRLEISKADWPTYRGDASRSGWLAADISPKLRPLWTAKVGPGATQAIAVGDRVFVACKDDCTVHAIEGHTGNRIWETTLSGRIDSPPTYYAGTLLVGSHDGYVYCLDAATGRLRWRFCAAPIDERCVAYDQVESVWPVHGSVLVHDGVAWCCAGRSSYLDGGLWVFRLNPITGEQLSCTRIDSLGEQDEQPPIEPTMFARLEIDGAKNDILSTNGTHVFLRHWTFDLDGHSVAQTIPHLMSPTGFTDDTWFRRTYWLYGAAYVSGAQGWARAGNVCPSGRILCLTDDRIYGFGRDWYPPSPGVQHQMYLAGERERLFAASKITREVTADTEIALPRKRKNPSKSGNTDSPPTDDSSWTRETGFQVKSLLVTGTGDRQYIFAAGPIGNWIISEDAFEGRKGSVLRVVAAADGSTVNEVSLPGVPIFDGLSAARGRVYMTLSDGRLVCFATAE